MGERVCRNHRLAPKDNNGFNQFNETDDYVIQSINHQKQEDNIYDKSNIFNTDSKTEIVSQGFLKKYVAFCKAMIHPILSDDAISLLASMWSLLRQKDFNEKDTTSIKVLPITIRSYETLIRLSTAHAKLRQSQ